MNYIIIQAGGKGSRMERLTQNKPKALVPVKNLPMIFHLFRKYQAANFIVIGDYKFEVLEKYLEAFAEGTNYTLVNAQGGSGTCAGLNDALKFVPDGKEFMLVWCDLVLPENFFVPQDGKNYIGISKDFKCRWKFDCGIFAEESSLEQGVAGLFVFSDKSVLSDVPATGEFVRYLSGKKIEFAELSLKGAKEYGLILEWEKLPAEKCRPFNRITESGERLTKEAVDEMGRKLAEREAAWYKLAAKHDFKNIPRIYDFKPLVMEKIRGKNIYEYENFSVAEKKNILRQIVSCLKEIHKFGKAPSDKISFYDAYIEKTFLRLEKVKNLVPFARDETVCVNGRVCRNVFYAKDRLEELMQKYFPKNFCFLHGDCTFSNMMLRKSGEVVLIAPRGYFGKTEIYGDEAYDWAKIYYSLVGNYDQFNLKRFELLIGEHDVNLKIKSNGWEEGEAEFFNLLGNEVCCEQIKLIHAIIWLSLTTYAWQDYDSICGAFYNGLYYLEEVL